MVQPAFELLSLPFARGTLHLQLRFVFSQPSSQVYAKGEIE
jgi:hypothetical protein